MKLGFQCLVLFLCLSLFSCSLTVKPGTGYPSQTELPDLLTKEGAAGEEWDEEEGTQMQSSPLDSLQTYQFGGRAFTVAVYDGCDFFGDGSTDGYQAALVTRNAAVEAKCGVSLVSYQNLTAESFYTDLRTAYQSGTLKCDGLLVPVRVMSLFAVNGLLVNIHSVPFLDMDAKYTHQKEMAAYTVGTVGYGYFSDIADSSPFIRCLYVNENGVKDANVLYDAVLNGTWDYDAFYTAVKSTAFTAGLAVNGNEEELALDLFLGGGDAFMVNNPPKTPSLKDMEEIVTAFSQQFSKLKQDAKVSYFADAFSALKVFSRGNCAFYLGDLADGESLKNTTVPWGILPLPHDGEAGSGYAARMGVDRMCMGVMKGTDYAFSGKIINTLAAASYELKQGRLSSAVYSFLPSNTAAKMYRLISDSVYTDLGIDYGEIYTTLYSASRDVLVNTVVHGMEYRKLYNNANNSFTRFIRDYTFYD